MIAITDQLFALSVCGKPLERVSPVLVRLTSRSDSDFERSNISLKRNKPNGVDLNSTVLIAAFERTKENFYGFRQTVVLKYLLVVCIWRHQKHDANYDRFAQIFVCKTMQRVFVPNLKLFGPTKTELWAKEVGEFSIILYGKRGWWAFFCPLTSLLQYKCMEIF